MTAQLVPINPRSAPAVPLQRPVILIGRHPECDVRIDAPEISRRHCCLAVAYDRLVIRDLGSRNGVRVNGRIVEEVVLRAGDEIAIAQFLYRLDSPDPAPAPVGVHRSSLKPPPELPASMVPDDDFVPLLD